MANNLAYLRYKAGLTQTEVAHKIGSSRQMISLIDNGTTRYGTNIVVEKADFTSGKPSGAASSRQTESRNIDSEEILPMPDDDDIPF